MIIEKINNNPSFRIINPSKNISYSIEEILGMYTLHSRERCLSFLYLDKHINSIAVVLKFIESEHAIALLDNSISTELKLELEEKYKPDIIYDTKRDSINNYEFIDSLFYTPIPKENKLNKNIKFLLSTSGTTGSPKFVKLSEDNLFENARSIAAYLPINNKSHVPLNLPVFYSYGLSVLLSNSLYGGAIYATEYSFMQKEFWEELTQHSYETFAGVPYNYEILKRIGFLKKKYPSLKYLTQAGGKLSENLILEFSNWCSENSVLFYIMYGQTEASARISYLDPKMIKEKTGSIGKPIKNGTFKIEEGELNYKGPNVFGGYATDSIDLETYKSPLWLKTGDLAKVDQDGYYFITGRIKRFSKINGKRVNLDELENFIKINFPDNLVAVLNDKDKFIKLYSVELDNVKEVKKAIYSAYGIHPAKIKLEIINTLPLTSNGKINYKALKSKDV